jgi:hypothetical protein
MAIKTIHPFYFGALGLAVLAFFLQSPIKAGGRYLLKTMKGQRSTLEVVAALAPAMRERFPDWKELCDGKELAILAFKEEHVLELWKQGQDEEWAAVKSWDFTGYSGDLGPKQKEGDLQIPEGLYRIEYLNPNSSYHLSMKVDYPNPFDREQAQKEGRTDLGGDIMIHGSSSTIGCIPIGNEGIEELFFLIAENGYRNTRVIFAPRDLRDPLVEAPSDLVPWGDELYAQIREALQPFR